MQGTTLPQGTQPPHQPPLHQQHQQHQPPLKALSGLAEQVVASVGAVCDALSRRADARTLALLPALARTLAVALRSPQPVARAASARALQRIERCVVARVAALVRQPDTDRTEHDDPLNAAMEEDDESDAMFAMPHVGGAAMGDGLDDMDVEGDGDGGGRARGGGAGTTDSFSPTARAWLGALETLCSLHWPSPAPSSTAAGDSCSLGSYSLEARSIAALMESAQASSLRAAPPLAAEYAAALLGCPDAQVCPPPCPPLYPPDPTCPPLTPLIVAARLPRRAAPRAGTGAARRRGRGRATGLFPPPPRVN